MHGDTKDWQEIVFSEESKLSAKTSNKAIIRRYKNEWLSMTYLNQKKPYH